MGWARRVQQAWSSEDPLKINTLLPGQRLWLTKLPEPRLMVGLEALAIQGWPASELERSVAWDCLMSDLAGNAISGQIWAALLIASFACLPQEVFFPRRAGAIGSAAPEDASLSFLDGLSRID